MKSDSKSALQIKQSLTIFLILIALGVSIQLLVSNNQINLANKNIEIINTVQLADATNRAGTVTARSSVNRNTVSQNVTEQNTQLNEQTIVNTESVDDITQVEEPKYKSIEEITISRDMDLTVRCGISKEDFKTLMDNTKADSSNFFFDNSDLIYDLCEKYEINEVFFCGLIAGESGWNIASNHRTKHNYISMMASSGNMITYSSVEEGLEAAAKLLHNKYLTEGGSCYSGKTLSGVQRRFCPGSSTWVG